MSLRAWFGSKRPSGRRLRVAIARISQETNALSPVLTELADFEQTHWLQGDELAHAISAQGFEAKGFLRHAELSGVRAAADDDGAVELVPLFSAWAVPAGPLSAACFETLRAKLESALRGCGEVDGLVLVLHGAMGAETIRDPETVLLEAARQALGEGVPIAVTYDLHGNLTRRRVAAAQLGVAYRTNPHRDHARVGRDAARLLFATARGEVRPTSAWRSLPMLLGGGITLDVWRPMHAIYARCRAMEAIDGVLSASVFMCHPWNDDPALGWSTLVTTDDDPALAERLADELAERCWAVRHELPPEFSSVDAALAEAKAATLARRTGVVMLSDASDVVSAGAPGDSTHLLRALVERGEGMRVYAAIRDPEALRCLYEAREGDEVALEVGGTLDPERSGGPLRIEGMLMKLASQEGAGRCAVVAIDPPEGIAQSAAGDVRLVVTEGPALAMKPAFYRNLGLRMRDADVVVTKNFFPFRLFYLPVARKTIYVRTRGVTDPDAAFELAFDGPMHPRDRVDTWRDRDRIRRGL